MHKSTENKKKKQKVTKYKNEESPLIVVDERALS